MPPVVFRFALFATLVACSVAWCALAFWIARLSPIAEVLQRRARTLLPLLFLALGAYILGATATDGIWRPPARSLSSTGLPRAPAKERSVTPHDAIRLFSKTLENLEKCMDKAGEHAKARSFDVDVLAQARLAPDQFSFTQQVQAACDQAKYAAAYLGGKQAPSHPDTEKTFAELRERIRKCTGFLATLTEKDFAGAEERKVAPPWLGGRWLRGHDYLVHVAVPNFFFHVTMAYAILRHNGVELGKRDFMGQVPGMNG